MNNSNGEHFISRGTRRPENGRTVGQFPVFNSTFHELRRDYEAAVAIAERTAPRPQMLTNAGVDSPEPAPTPSAADALLDLIPTGGGRRRGGDIDPSAIREAVVRGVGYVDQQNQQTRNWMGEQVETLRVSAVPSASRSLS